MKLEIVISEEVKDLLKDLNVACHDIVFQLSKIDTITATVSPPLPWDARPMKPMPKKPHVTVERRPIKALRIAGTNWSPEEIALLTDYYARGCNPAGISRNLMKQGYDRTTQAVRNKTLDLKRKGIL
jgi:hypothetical protein